MSQNTSPRQRAAATKIANTRGRILAAADELFVAAANQGRLASSVTPAQVARKARVSQSSLYNHFKGGVAAIAYTLTQNPGFDDRPYANGVRALAALEIERAKSSDDEAARLSSLIDIDSSNTTSVDVLRIRVRDADTLSDSSSLAVSNRILSRLNLGWRLARGQNREEGLSILADAMKYAEKPWHSWMRRQAEDMIVNVLLTPAGGRVSKTNLTRAYEILRQAAERIPIEPVAGRLWPRLEVFKRTLLAEMLSANGRPMGETMSIYPILADDASAALTAACQEHTTMEVFRYGDHEDVLELILAFESLALITKRQADRNIGEITELWPADADLGWWRIDRSTTLVSMRDILTHSHPADPGLEILGNWPRWSVTAVLAAVRLGFVVARDDSFYGAICGRTAWRREWDAWFRQYSAAYSIGTNRHIASKISGLLAKAPTPKRSKIMIDADLLDELERVARDCRRTGQTLRDADAKRLRMIWNALP